jgi:hypothetical protein
MCVLVGKIEELKYILSESLKLVKASGFDFPHPCGRPPEQSLDFQAALSRRFVSHGWWNVNWTGLGSKRSWPIIFAWSETTKHVNKDSQCHRSDLNRVPLDYKFGALSLELTYASV